MVGMSASVIFPCTINVQKKLPSGTGPPGWSRKKGCKTLYVCTTITLQHYMQQIPVNCTFLMDRWNLYTINISSYECPFLQETIISENSKYFQKMSNNWFRLQALTRFHQGECNVWYNTRNSVTETWRDTSLTSSLQLKCPPLSSNSSKPNLHLISNAHSTSFSHMATTTTHQLHHIIGNWFCLAYSFTRKQHYQGLKQSTLRLRTVEDKQRRQDRCRFMTYKLMSDNYLT